MKTEAITARTRAAIKAKAATTYEKRLERGIRRYVGSPSSIHAKEPEFYLRLHGLTDAVEAFRKRTADFTKKFAEQESAKIRAMIGREGTLKAQRRAEAALLAAQPSAGTTTITARASSGSPVVIGMPELATTTGGSGAGNKLHLAEAA